MDECNKIRERIHKHNLSFLWLISQLHYAGVETTKSELSSVLSGTRKGAKADDIIRLSKEILDVYETSRFAQG